MDYFEVYLSKTGELLAMGTARECREQLGCSSVDTFYALANRAKRGKNKKYKVVQKKGGECDYPVMGRNDPIFKVSQEEQE